ITTNSYLEQKQNLQFSRMHMRLNAYLDVCWCFGICVCHCVNDATRKLIFGSGTNLKVESKEESKTAAFVLGSDKDNKEGKARACLITDFSFHKISVNLGAEDVPVVPSVIKGDKQYSVVVFLPESKARSNFNCSADVNGSKTTGHSNDIENVCESELAYVFESDKKLNSLSLMVLGLRVIFLKSIAFNVLMTVRAIHQIYDQDMDC
ncbi:M1-specific T cell receptor alpha chain-like, partial [Acipenser oxyrinchus oxyrinchus]